MKNVLALSIVVFLVLYFNSVSAQKSANNTAVEDVAQVFKADGNDLIKNRIDESSGFIKDVNKSNRKQLPKVAYIFNRPVLTTLSFDGIDLLIENNKVIGVKNIKLTDSVLNHITTKLILLDKIQFNYAEKINMTYFKSNRDIQEIKVLERQYSSALKILSTTIRDIASYIKKPNQAGSIDVNLANMRQPNVDLSMANQNVDAQIQLTAK